MNAENNIIEWMCQKIIKYIDENNQSNRKVLNFKSGKDLGKIMNLELTENGDKDSIYQSIEDYTQYSLRTGHKHFFNQLYADITIPSFVGETFATLTNCSMATYETSPAGTLIEDITIRKLNSIVGFDKGDGIFVLGGSYANMVGMHCARNSLFKKAKMEGITRFSAPLTCFTSEEAHYSIEKAANLLGIGTNNVIKVKSDSCGKMIPAELENEILKSKERGEIPFFVSATAGTTVTGSIDPIGPIITITKKHLLWLHVDGAFGGSLLLSQKFASEFDQIHLADSLTWDMHKVLGIPITCSAILLKEKGILKECSSGGGENYLFHNQEEKDIDDFGEKSFQCGRKSDAFKVWLNWKYYGTKGLINRIDKLLSLVSYAENIIKKISFLEVVVPRQSLSLCFRYNSEALSLEQTNELNFRIRNQMLKDGLFVVNYARWKGYLLIRLVCLNPNTKERDIDNFFEHFVSIGKKIEKELVLK